MTEGDQLLLNGAYLIDIGAMVFLMMSFVWLSAPLYVRVTINGTIGFGMGLAMINLHFGIYSASIFRQEVNHD